MEGDGWVREGGVSFFFFLFLFYAILLHDLVVGWMDGMVGMGWDGMGWCGG